MSQLPEITVKTWRATTTTFHLLAICCTTFRIYHRFRKHQLWWDDYWAGASLSATLVFIFAPWLRDDDGHPPPSRSKPVFLFWFSAMLYPLVIWTARISIGMSIARLTPPKTIYRYLLYAMNGIFAAMCISQLLYKIIICTRDTAWHNNPSVQCYLGSPIGILTLSMDLAADTCLVAIPLRMLWRVKLPRSQRRLILSIFAASVASSMASIIYTVFVFQAQKYRGNWGARIGFVAAIKAAITLLVCNLLVIVTYLYRTFWKDGDETVSEPSETRSKPTHTTITPTVPYTGTPLVLTVISTPRPSTADFSLDFSPADVSGSVSLARVTNRVAIDKANQTT